MNNNNNIDTLAHHEFKIDPLMKIGYVSLNISDLQKSIEFYQSKLGFKLLGRSSNDRALLSGNGNRSSHLIELLCTGNHEFSSGTAKRAGLYHFAILLPERKYLADMLQNLKQRSNEVYFEGLADHLVSESIYIRDPDFNGVEIYSDRPRSEWHWNYMNQIEMATLPLRTADLLEESTEKGWREMPAKTTIGHVHLHVKNLARAKMFYHKILGLNLTTTYPGAYFFAARRYHHHVAVNTWLGSDISPAQPQKIGLNHFAVRLSSIGEYEKILSLLSKYNMIIDEVSYISERNKSAFVQDINGIKILLYTE